MIQQKWDQRFDNNWCWPFRIDQILNYKLKDNSPILSSASKCNFIISAFISLKLKNLSTRYLCIGGIFMEVHLKFWSSQNNLNSDRNLLLVSSQNVLKTLQSWITARWHSMKIPLCNNTRMLQIKQSNILIFQLSNKFQQKSEKS